MAFDPAESPAETKDLFGLTSLCAKPRERLAIRTRSSGSTQSAWRLEVSCDQGTGAIVVAEVSPRESYYRGEGVFLGWSQEKLTAAHDALLRRSDEPPFELPQLG